MLTLRNDAPLRPMDVMDERPRSADRCGPAMETDSPRDTCLAAQTLSRFASSAPNIARICRPLLFLVAGRRRLTCLGQCANNIGVGDLSIKLLVVPPKTVSRKRECPYAPMTSKSPLRAAT